MPVKHAHLATQPDGPDSTRVQSSDWNDPHLTPPFVIPLFCDAATLLLTNLVTALTEMNGNRSRTKADLTNCSDARVVVRLMAIGSVNCLVKVQWSTDEAAWTDLCTVGIGGGAAGTRAGAWTALAAGAKADVFLRLCTISNDAVADPAFGNIYLQVR